MNRREFLLTGSFFLAGSGASFASQSEDDVAHRLAREGFRITERKRTWLGRIKIQAQKGRKLREVVLDPSTGEVLRDYTEDLASGPSNTKTRSNRRDDNGRGAGAESDGKEGSGGGSGPGGSESGGSETGDGGSGAGGEPGGGTGGGGEQGGEPEERGETESPEREKAESNTRERRGRRKDRDVKG